MVKPSEEMHYNAIGKTLLLIMIITTKASLNEERSCTVLIVS